MKTHKVVIEVYKDCGTCIHTSFDDVGIDEPTIARCSFDNKIVTKPNQKLGIEYIDIDCDKYKFDEKLLDDSGFCIDKVVS